MLGIWSEKKIGLNPEDIVCTTLLLHRASGLALGAGMSFSHKVKLVYSSEAFDVQELRTTLKEEYCTTLVAQPSELASLVSAENGAIPSLQKIIVSASPEDMPSQALLNSLSTLGAKSVIVVFSTDTIVISTSDVNKFNEKSIGVPLPHTSAKVVGNDGKSVPFDSKGSLVVSGFTVSGEVNTGLQVSMQADGSLTLA